MRMSIENLLHDTTEEILQQAPVEQAQARAAITGLNGQALKERPILIDEADLWAKGHPYYEYL